MKKLLFVLLILPVTLLAAENDYMEIARTRKYVGGADEGDLKVQAVLYQAPSKKKKPVKVEPNEGF
ncbi:MAG: hypothetical protein ACXVAX_03330 [Pseudobdellovibrio sp.]